MSEIQADEVIDGLRGLARQHAELHHLRESLLFMFGAAPEMPSVEQVAAGLAMPELRQFYAECFAGEVARLRRAGC